MDWNAIGVIIVGSLIFIFAEQFRTLYNKFHEIFWIRPNLSWKEEHKGVGLAVGSKYLPSTNFVRFIAGLAIIIGICFLLFN
jgi:hypothetical protein